MLHSKGAPADRVSDALGGLWLEEAPLLLSSLPVLEWFGAPAQRPMREQVHSAVAEVGAGEGRGEQFLWASSPLQSSSLSSAINTFLAVHSKRVIICPAQGL